jgi:hypothetical protein
VTGVLEINDVALRMHSPDREDIVEPGFALVDVKDGLLLGQAALEKSRINPPRTENDFWHWMDTQPIKAAARSYQHNADLVFAQLEDLCRRSGDNRELNLIVPSNYSSDQLSMLLGIAQHAGVEVKQVYDAALVSTINNAGTGLERLVYMDMYLHHCVITRLVRVDDNLGVDEFRVVPGAGLLNFFDVWLHGVADLFVRGTRFDPLHDAHTEQKAFDQINGYYQSPITDGGANPDRLTIELENRHIELSRQQFSSMGEPILRKIQGVADSLDTDGSARRLVSDRIARLPGWEGFIGATPTGASAAVNGVLNRSTETDSDGVGYVVSLPLPADGPAESVIPKDDVVTATHLLRGLEALPLRRGTTYLEIAGSGVRLRSDKTQDALASLSNSGGEHDLTVFRDGEIAVNGDIVSSAALGLGDRIAVTSSGDELTLISVRTNGTN